MVTLGRLIPVDRIGRGPVAQVQDVPLLVVGDVLELDAAESQTHGKRLRGNAEPRAAALRRLRALVREKVPEGVSLVDELIAERRDEARREEAELEARR
jgi:hypothetical protein